MKLTLELIFLKAKPKELHKLGLIEKRKAFKNQEQTI